MLRRLALLALPVGFLAAAAIVLPLSSAEAAAPGSVVIEQVSANEYGTWMMLAGSGTVAQSSDSEDPKSHSFTVPTGWLGPMTLIVDPPAGAVVKVTTYRNDVLVDVKSSQQISFTMYPGEWYRFVIQYSVAQQGMLGITSEPTGVLFRLKGPSARKRLVGRTPFTFTNLMLGKYTIYFSAIEGCILPRPYNKVVREEERTTLHVQFDCRTGDEPVVAPRELSKRDIVEEKRKMDAIAAARKKLGRPVQ